MNPQVPTVESTPALVESPSPTSPVVPKTNWAISVLFLVLGILIGMGGFWGYQTYLSQQIISQPTPSPIASATIDPTANWKTYTNTKYNYSIKYPNSWTITSGEPGPGEIPLTPTSRGLNIYPSIYKSSATARAFIEIIIDGPENTAFKGFDDWLNSLHKTFFKVVSTTQDGLAGLSGETTTGTYDGYGFPADIKRFALKSLDGKDYYSITATIEKGSQEKEVVNQILSTFKFLPTAPASTASEDLINLVKITAAAEGKTTTDKIIIGQTTVSGNYAEIAYNYVFGGGAVYWAAKVNGSWKIVTRGQEVPPCSVLAQYNFPSSFGCNP